MQEKFSFGQIGIKNWGMLMLLGLVVMSRPAGAAYSDEESALRFLQSGNAAEAVWVKNFQVIQGGQRIDVYESIGREERNAQLGRRPILHKAQPKGYFVRGRDWVVLVDRSLPLKLEFSVEWIRHSGAGRQSLALQPVTEIFAYLAPGRKDELALKSKDGSYALDIVSSQKVQSILVQMRSGNERHEIKLVLIGRGKPVTFSGDSGNANNIDNPAAE